MTGAPDPFAWFDDTAAAFQALAEFAAALTSYSDDGAIAAEDHANGEDT